MSDATSLRQETADFGLQPHHVLPAERLYWAILDPRPLGRKNLADGELGFLFEDSLPVPIDAVHARYARLSDGRVVACGIDRSVIVTIDRTTTLSVTPDRIPDPVRVALGECAREVDPSDLNLLVGEFEPVAVRRFRRRALSVAATFLLASVALLTTGVLRRGNALDRAAEAVETHRSEILRVAYPERSADGTTSAIPPELRLLGEVRRLASTRSSELPELPDAAPALGALLAAWPEGVEARCDAIAVNERSATLRGIVRDPEAVTRLEDAFRRVPGWSMPGSVQFNRDTANPTFTISLVREDSAALGGAR